MICNCCGEKINDNIFYCPKCGAKAKEYVAPKVNLIKPKFSIKNYFSIKKDKPKIAEKESLKDLNGKIDALVYLYFTKF